MLNFVQIHSKLWASIRNKEIDRHKDRHPHRDRFKFYIYTIALQPISCVFSIRKAPSRNI